MAENPRARASGRTRPEARVAARCRWPARRRWWSRSSFWARRRLRTVTPDGGHTAPRRRAKDACAMRQPWQATPASAAASNLASVAVLVGSGALAAAAGRDASVAHTSAAGRTAVTARRAGKTHIVSATEQAASPWAQADRGDARVALRAEAALPAVCCSRMSAGSRAPGVTANQVTLAAAIGSLAVGAIVAAAWPARWPFLLMPVWLFIRMALNAIDGMLAREHGQKSRLGAYLNEICDVVSDAALYAPFALLPAFGGFWIGLVIVLAALTELAGVLGPTVGASRRYDGPMGKSDRALVFGALGLWAGLRRPVPGLDCLDHGRARRPARAHRRQPRARRPQGRQAQAVIEQFVAGLRHALRPRRHRGPGGMGHASSRPPPAHLFRQPRQPRRFRPGLDGAAEAGPGEDAAGRRRRLLAEGQGAALHRRARVQRRADRARGREAHRATRSSRWRRRSTRARRSSSFRKARGT